MTIFDNDSIERRARTFHQGYRLYKRKGLDHLDYVDFHIERTNWSRRVLISMTGTFILIGLIFLFHGLWILGIPLLSIPIILIFLFENRKVRKNRLLMLEVLSSERTRQRFFQARENQIFKLFLHPRLANVDNESESSSINPGISIDTELMEIAQCENKFNKMPMLEVVEIFSLMCCPELRRECPQIARTDLIYFLKTAFLEESTAGEKKKISFVSKTIFRLLTDHFLGFHYKQVSKNFRDKRNGKSFLILSAKK